MGGDSNVVAAARSSGVGGSGGSLENRPVPSDGTLCIFVGPHIERIAVGCSLHNLGYFLSMPFVPT